MDKLVKFTVYSLKFKEGCRQRLCGGVARFLLMAALLIGGGVTAWAQGETVTVGDGTNASNYAPFNNLYYYSTNASIYNASDIGVSGTITQISYYCNAAESLTFSELNVYFAITPNAIFSSTTDWPTTYNLVYSGSNIPVGGSTGWLNITLDNEFTYDKNQGNLMVIVTKKCDSYSWSQTWRYTSSSNTNLYRQNDYNDNYADITNTSQAGTLSENRPNIQFTFKKYYFSATALSTAGGSASVSPGTANSYTSTTTATFTATPNSGYRFLGWSETESGSIVSTDNPYAATITSTSTNSASPTNTTLYARFQANVNPTAIAANNASVTTYVGTPIAVGYTLTPGDAYDDVTGTSSSPSIFTVGTISNGSAAITPVAVGTATLTLTAHKINGDAISPAATVTVNVRDRAATPVITFTPTGSDNKASCEITCTTPGTTIRYTVNGSDPTASDNLYGSAFEVNDGDVVRAIAFISTEGWDNSAVATKTWAACSATKPSISNTASGSTAYVSITAGSGDVIYYTTDGGTPSDNSTPYTGTFTSTGGATVKAIAYHDGCHESDIATYTVIGSGVSGGIVTINDYEDHNWTYYQSSSNLPDGYPTEYLSSPDPRNVKITYMRGSVSGASGAAISGLTGEGDTMMVYYKTLEKSVPGMTGDYPYTVISNPYSKRPKNGSTYYGFAGWKLYSGGNYISEYSNGDTLPLDATIHFTNLNTNYTANCTSAEIVFVATWTTANVQYGTSAPTFSGGNYETNFWVLNGNVTNLSVPANVTVTARYPDGSDGYYNSATITGTITAGGNNAKVEFVKMNSTGAVSAAGYTFTIGRGVENSSNGGDLRGCNSDKNCVHTFRVESGTYATLHNFTNGLTNTRNCDQLMILGCDYDRAKGTNNKLTIRGAMYVGSSIQLNRAANSLYVRTYIKSGNFGSTVNVWGNSAYAGSGGSQTYYYSVSGTHNAGRRYLCMEGGRIDGIAGGMDESNKQTTTARAFDLRVRGSAQIDGVVYGAAEFANAKGTRAYVFTGGSVGGWIAGGANGTKYTNGKLEGSSYIYIGGTTRVESDPSNSNKVLNSAVGGTVFGAGCGFCGTSSSGQVTLGTTVVVADESYVERGVYGGGAFGYTEATSNIYLTGGTVDCKVGGVTVASTSGNNDNATRTGVNYSTNIQGGVYGGACQNKAGTNNIKVYGGTVNGGVYGGCNYSGAVANNINVDVYGTDESTQSNPYAVDMVFGGGNQANYSGTPQVTVHCGTDATTPISIGEVYGGGNQATVTGTNVTIEAGNKIGDVYGGGRQANVGNDGTSVTVTGGTIGRVFGGNNLSGTIASGTAGKISVTVDKTGSCPMKIGQVFGGGNQAASQVGSITIGCTGTLVTPLAAGQRYGYDQEGIGAVYGGANNAGITGDITLDIVSGIVDSVFGGNNAGGAINGDITVNINKNGSAACASDWYVGYVFGGGNMATYSEKTSGHPAVNVKAGKVTHHVFGGGNGSGAAVTGNPTVTLSGTAEVGGNVFGGGNAAAVTGNTKVLIKD